MGDCKVKKQKVDAMMLENRTLEEQKTRELGKSYEIGIKTTLSPHHATACFFSRVPGVEGEGKNKPIPCKRKL